MSPLGKPTYSTKGSSRGFQDILKRRLLTLCSGCQKSRKFQPCSGLSNGRCPTGYKIIPLVPIGTPFAYIRMRTRVP